MLPSSEKLVIHPYFDTYLKLVQHPDIQEELLVSSKLVLNKLKALAEADLSFQYAPEKWTIAQLVLHCIETESIFNFRALTIARAQSKPTMDGFDENHYADSVNSEAFDLDALISYFQNVRGSTMRLLQSLRAEQLDKIGSASGHDVEVKALFFATSGHWRHHINVLNEKYLSN
jgi:hypothetical protein